MKYSGNELLLDDPTYLEKLPDQNIWDSVSWGHSKTEWRILEQAIEYIPEMERDILWMSFKEGISQELIGERFGISQSAVYQRIQRAIDRIKFILKRASYSSEEISDYLHGLDVLTENEATVTSLFWKTTSQVEVANRLGKTPGAVYSSLVQAISKLDNIDSEYYDTIQHAYDNPSILRF